LDRTDHVDEISSYPESGNRVFGNESHAGPNIVLIMADDLGWGDVSYHGSEIRTPNIDHIAQEGIELEHLYGHLGGFVDYDDHTLMRSIDWQRNGVIVREPGYTTEPGTRL
jgi:hypothetical protein